MTAFTPRSSSWRGAPLTCGVLAAITYVATDIYAGMRYAGYSFVDQAVSELFAIGAPTARIVIPLFSLSSAFLAAFAHGVWSAVPHTRAWRWLALMLLGNAVNSLLLWNVFPMHMRGEAQTLTDVMHLVLSVNPFVLLSVIAAMFACPGWFRLYSAAIVLIVVIPAVASFSNIAEFAATGVTPGMGIAERIAQYGYQLWLATLAVALLRASHRRQHPSTTAAPINERSSPFRSREGEAAFRSAYDAILAQWRVPFDELDIETRFGSTHVIVSGALGAPPLVLLHGYMATSTMWALNIADFTKEYRVYAIDVMGQPGKSAPSTPVRDAGDYVTWLTATLDALGVTRASLVGVSFGGWLAGTYAIAKPERVVNLVLLSSGGLLPLTRQFAIRGMLMVLLPTRFAVNSCMRWLGITEPDFLGLIYLGLKHFRMPPETARVMPAVFPDDALRTLRVPTLVLYGDHEVICDPRAALARAQRLIPRVEADLIPDCSHDMCGTQAGLVDPRVLGFLKHSEASTSPAA